MKISELLSLKSARLHGFQDANRLVRRGAHGNRSAFLIEKEYIMKKTDLRSLIFMALCCDLGLFAKKLISPAANFITEFLHIPGGIATSFSLMFLVIAAALMPFPLCATVMGVVQSLLALCFGMTGSMGALAPIGYILPGIVIDLVFFLAEKLSGRRENGIQIASVLASVTACLTANFIVFNLRGIVLFVYTIVAATSGSVCGLLGEKLVERLHPVIGLRQAQEKISYRNKETS